MAVRDIFKVSRKTFINPSAWIDVEGLKNFTVFIAGNIKGLFQAPEPIKTETFKEAMQRMGVKESDLHEMAESYRWYAYFFLAIAFLVFIFSLYLLFYHGSFTAWLLAGAAGAFSLAQAFRFHFWFFQIKHRKLGCTFKEWKQGVLHNKDVAP